MAESYDVINLSDLPVPDAIVVPDASVIFGAWLARLRELDPEFDALVESDPVYKQGEVTAFQLTLAFQRVNDAVRAVFLASAQKADLDQIGATFNVERMVVVPANPDAVPPTDAIMEEDDAFRERIQLSWSQLNTAGARNAYRFHARSADEDVLDADACGPEEHGRAGEVDVYVLSREGNGAASEALLDAVSARLNADEIRPLTDFVTVKSAIINDYSVTAELEIPDGPDAGEVLENAKNTLLSYTRLANRINGMVPLSAIYAALQQTGVARVILSSPRADIEPATGTAPRCAAVNVTRKEV
ncbi:TPA: baseplate J/gp47 family protein [Escherichia coli]|uniref:baseplate assembly protein n=1 Tax=Escherichia coli TaxID=562 RepID=UPI00050944A0|nr:baseplate J/gp47 family protein [Escherichia coli]EFQ3871474.1 baseplate assembly protein [Escherichia coli]EJQ6168126.1 baseplate J/gp47 family protein [Escherichia coli]HBD5072151.1 baseplate J/gp47 family protein [Escherichia coli]HBD5152851.1 baseplate J/gp47 family protein [Escherichia coli]HCO7636998.1 baseplate J/gp47 family protein [Escherichia coli]